MTITIGPPETTLANLNERAQVEGRPAAELAMEVVTERYGSFYEEEFPLADDAVEKIERGFEDMDAGRILSLEDSRSRIESLLAARRENGSA